MNAVAVTERLSTPQIETASTNAVARPTTSAGATAVKGVSLDVHEGGALDLEVLAVEKDGPRVAFEGCIAHGMPCAVVQFIKGGMSTGERDLILSKFSVSTEIRDDSNLAVAFCVAGALIAIRDLGRTYEFGFPARLHFLQTLGPARDDPVKLESRWFAALKARVRKRGLRRSQPSR